MPGLAWAEDFPRGWAPGVGTGASCPAGFIKHLLLPDPSSVPLEPQQAEPRLQPSRLL